MHRGVINVISAANSAFIQPLATSYISILENDPEHQYNFFLLPDHLTDRDMMLLRSIIARYDNATIKIVEVNEELLANGRKRPNRQNGLLPHPSSRIVAIHQPGNLPRLRHHCQHKFA